MKEWTVLKKILEDGSHSEWGRVGLPKSHTGEWCPEGRSQAAVGKGLGSESHDESWACFCRKDARTRGKRKQLHRQTRFLSLLLHSGTLSGALRPQAGHCGPGRPIHSRALGTGRGHMWTL